MAAWEELQNGILRVARNRIRREGRRSVSAPDPVYGRVFRGFVEVLETYDALLDIAVYLRRFGFRGTRVSKNRYLRYHIQGHLQELYILHERLIAYARVLERTYKGSRRAAAFKSASFRTQQIVRKTLAGVVGTRGSHVHTRRFTDKQLEDLTGVELVAEHSDDLQFRRMLSWQYREVKAALLKTVTENNQEAQKLLDALAAEFLPILFTKAGRLYRP